MANRAKRKGDRGERQAAEQITQLLGTPVRRQLGAGRADDTGDLDGVDGWCLQVKNWKDITRAITEGIRQLATQQTNRGTDNAALLIKHRTHGWLVVTTLEQWTRTVKSERQHRN